MKRTAINSARLLIAATEFVVATTLITIVISAVARTPLPF